jgi:ketosteroid isomerase-like protein
MADHVELVRQLWSAFERGGIEAVLELTDPDVEWEPYGGGGVVYHGHDGLRAYMEGRRERNEEADGRLYSAFSKGDYVVARGEVRIQGPQGLVTMQPGWLYEFREGKLIRFRGFPTQDAAMRAAGLAPQDAQSIVREIWSAATRRDTDRLMELCSDDVVWLPYNGREPEYHTPEGVREYYQQQYADIQSISLTEYAFREFGPELVLYTGSLHTVDRAGGIAQRQIHYLFWVRDGKVFRAQSFAQRVDAIATAEAAESQSPG